MGGGPEEPQIGAEGSCSNLPPLATGGRGRVVWRPGSAVERVTTWDPSLQGPAPPPPAASATFHSQSFSAQRDQGGDPLSLPPPTPPLPPSLPLWLLCAPELSSCHFNRIKASE